MVIRRVGVGVVVSARAIEKTVVAAARADKSLVEIMVKDDYVSLGSTLVGVLSSRPAGRALQR